MKKLLPIFLFAGMASLATAQTQVPNSNFEEWTVDKPAYNHYAPTGGWLSGTACASAGGNEVCSFTQQRTTDASSGSYAVMMYTVDDGDDHISYGTFGSVGAGFTTPAFTGRPTSFSFDYKFKTDDNQPMEVSVTLFTGSILDEELNIIGQMTYEFNTSTSKYVSVTEDIQYLKSGNPTSVLITFDYKEDPTTAFDTLKIDNLKFNYTATSINGAYETTEINAYVDNNVLYTSEIVENMSLTDMRGIVVANSTASSNEFSIGQLKSGVYVLNGLSDNKLVVKKILVK